MEQEAMSGSVVKTMEAEQQTEERTSNRDQETTLIHGLSVDRYRQIYNSVLQPSVLSELSKCKNNEDYVCRVLELKQQLWNALGRPRLQETVMEDGRVEVTEIFDLT